MTENTSKTLHKRPNLLLISMIRFLVLKIYKIVKLVQVNGVATIENINQMILLGGDVKWKARVEVPTVTKVALVVCGCCLPFTIVINYILMLLFRNLQVF